MIGNLVWMEIVGREVDCPSFLDVTGVIQRDQGDLAFEALAFFDLGAFVEFADRCWDIYCGVSDWACLSAVDQPEVDIWIRRTSDPGTFAVTVEDMSGKPREVARSTIDTDQLPVIIEQLEVILDTYPDQELYHLMEVEKSDRPADLKIVGFELTLDQLVQDEDEVSDHENRVFVTARARGSSAMVRECVVMPLSNLVGFRDQCKQLTQQLTPSARLDHIDGELQIAIRRDEVRTRRLRAEVQIRSFVPIREEHIFEYQIWQSQLGDIIRQCTAIVDRYPVSDDQLD